jgi:TolA-binding protein
MNVADLSEGLVIPIIAIFCTIGLPMLIGLVAVLTKHQRSMAELLNKQSSVDEGVRSEIQSLERKVDEMRTILMDHAMSLDQNVEQLSRRVESIERASERKSV